MSKNTKRTWYAVDLIVEPAASEAAEFAFNELDALGTEIDSLRKLPSEPVCVTGFFDAEPDEEAVRAAVTEALRIYDLPANSLISIRMREVEETDWLAEWKRHWKPQTVARFTIAPPWSEVGSSEQIVIRIEPNMAFGTGTHETTQLCLTAISEHYDPKESFLDVGTGTGILAIAAAKLGGETIFACDVDHDSVAIAKENAAANGVAEKITFAEGPITKKTPPFDLVCANLTLDVIEPLSPLLVEKTGRVLILSGILADQESAALNALRKLIVKDPKVSRSGEWIALTVRV
jgi:ribosomal protein L11 methyltransferase